jgi:hypothetical protein
MDLMSKKPICYTESKLSRNSGALEVVSSIRYGLARPCSLVGENPTQKALTVGGVC